MAIDLNIEDVKKKKLRRFITSPLNPKNYVAVALVDDPAIQHDFVWFSSSNEKIQYFKVEEEKGLISGPMMIPDLPILRFDEELKEYYYGYFTKEDIYNCLVTLQKYNLTKKVNLKHNQTEFVNDVFLLESFIVDSTRNMNSPKGYNLPDGTLFATWKVENDKIWNDIKAGKYSAFSIEGFFNLSTEVKISEKQKLINEIILNLDLINL